MSTVLEQPCSPPYKYSHLNMHGYGLKEKTSSIQRKDSTKPIDTITKPEKRRILYIRCGTFPVTRERRAVLATPKCVPTETRVHLSRLSKRPPRGATVRRGRNFLEYQQERTMAVDTWITRMYKEFHKDLETAKQLQREEEERLAAEFAKRNQVRPLLRFRRAVHTVVTLLKATTSNSRGQQLGESKVLSFTQYQDELLNNNRSNYGYGLTFDPVMYKAQRETLLSNEAKTILSLDPPDRTEEQLHVALLSLNTAVDAFTEFPIKMQQSLVSVGWYEHFEAKRVIIRQGHTADNFYFILSGRALVTILETDKKTGESRANTVATLKKGNSFGELALMHGAKRSATVTCKDDVELLAVGREDFIDIFMHVEKNTEPEHIQYLRTIDILRGWPIDRLPWDDPKTCLFTYFRRGVVMCRDSNRADWIYIIKSGSCKVLKRLLATTPNVPGLEQHQYKPVDEQQAKSWQLPQICRAVQTRSSGPSLSGSISNLYSSSECSDQQNSSKKEKFHSSFPGLPPIKHRTDEEVAQLLEQHKHALDRIYRARHENHRPKRVRIRTGDAEVKNTPQSVFVQVQKLVAKDTFGLEYVAFSLMDKCTAVSLVSDGAEAILINKKFFLQYLSDDMRKKLRTTIQPYPTEESLQQKLQDMSNWDAFKTMTVTDHMLFNKYVHDTLYL